MKKLFFAAAAGTRMSGASRMVGGLSGLESQKALVEAASIVTAMGNSSRLIPKMLDDVKGDPDAICVIVNQEIVRQTKQQQLVY